MKKTKALSLLLSLLLLLSSLTLPLLAVDAETAADPEQTQTDSADAPAEDDSVPEDRLLSSRTSFSVAAKAALLIDLNTGRAVYEQDADERVYPASLTKIMTCLLALENGNLSDVVTVSASALDDLDADSSVAGLQVGEQMTLENLLYCMMVVSGNDACNVIAEHIAGSVADFVRMMNQRAYELGCLNTHFSNPHGLHDESHYTTARDLSIITQAALKSENFRQIVDTYEYQLPDDNMRQNIPKLKTTNMLIYRSLSNTLYYPRAHGIKTGYTSQAGRCVISEATGDGLDLLGIVCGAATTVLDSGDLLMENFTECARLFDYGFDNYSYLPIMSPVPGRPGEDQQPAGAEAVAVAPEDEIRFCFRTTMTLIRWSRISLNSESVDAPVREGDVLAVTVSYAGEILDRRSCLPSLMWRARNFRPPQPGRRHISRKTGGSGS
ncbi:MAG: D-alanyl-D-alanine carboxypeptidase family protein [Oscillospiraceae bacterium]